MRTLLQSIMNAEWAVGQVIFRLVYKILKTDLSQFDTRAQRKMAQNSLNREWDALSLSIIDRDDDMSMESAAQNLGGVGEVFEFLKDMIAGASNIPKSILFGAQAGTLSASDRDAKNYFQAIQGDQETWLTPALKWLTKLEAEAETSRIELPSGVQYDDLDLSVDWNPLFDVDEQSQAETKLTEAQAQNQMVQAMGQAVDMGLTSPEDANQSLAEAGVVPEGLPDDDLIEGILGGLGNGEPEHSNENGAPVP